MEKERLDLLLVYANDLYRYIAKKLGEDYEPKNLIGLLGWLDEHNVIIHIQPEFYSQGINWNWQISFYNPETFDDPKNIMLSGPYFSRRSFIFVPIFVKASSQLMRFHSPFTRSIG